MRLECDIQSPLSCGLTEEPRLQLRLWHFNTKASCRTWLFPFLRSTRGSVLNLFISIKQNKRFLPLVGYTSLLTSRALRCYWTYDLFWLVVPKGLHYQCLWFQSLKHCLKYSLCRNITFVNYSPDQLQLWYEWITCLIEMHNQFICENKDVLMAPGADGNYMLLE